MFTSFVIQLFFVAMSSFIFFTPRHGAYKLISIFVINASIDLCVSCKLLFRHRRVQKDFMEENGNSSLLLRCADINNDSSVACFHVGAKGDLGSMVSHNNDVSTPCIKSLIQI